MRELGNYRDATNKKKKKTLCQESIWSGFLRQRGNEGEEEKSGWLFGGMVGVTEEGRSHGQHVHRVCQLRQLV